MNVLILTDFSETSENAGRYAADFLQDTSANFYLLNIHNFNFNRTANHFLENELVTTLDELQKDTEKLKIYSKNKKHRFNTILSSESLISAVRKALVEKKIDLIFVGTASQDKHSHPILGDHAYDVVQKIKCNIIAVPAGCSYTRPKKAVFPVDDSIIRAEDHQKILNNLDYLHSVDFKILGVRDGEVENPFKISNGERHDEPVPFTRELFKNIQQQYDIIVVIGKNLSICDRLLHTVHGFSANMNVKIPIFVYHG